MNTPLGPLGTYSPRIGRCSGPNSAGTIGPTAAPYPTAVYTQGT